MLAVVAGYGLAPAAHAAPTVLDTVVVSATRAAQDPLEVPAAIDRIEARDFARAQPRLSLAEALPRVPGVLARDRQNQAQDLQVSIRGFGARSTFGVRGVRLYTDGIPASMPDGQGQVSHLVLDTVDRIEVLRGPFSALYGNSSGGVIQLFSADPPPEAEWSVGPLVAGDGLRRGALGLRGPWPGGRAGGYAVDALEFRDEGFRVHGGGRHTGGQALLRGGIPGGGGLVVIANALDVRADDPQGLTAGELAGDRRAASPGALAFDTRKTTRQQQLGARIEQPLASSLLGAGAWVGTRAIEQFLAVPVAAQGNPLSGGGVVNLDRDFLGFDVRWRWPGMLGVRALAMTLGVEHQVSDEHRRGFENFVGGETGVRGALRRDENDRVDGTDEYVQLEWAPAPRWRADAGVRWSAIGFRSRDHYVTPSNPDDSGALRYRRATPVAGLLWRAWPWLSLYANAGTGFETPTLNELAYRADGTSGLNSALLPAVSDNVEAGVRGRRGGAAFGLAWFHVRTRDELVVAGSQGGRTTYANAAESARQGAEASWSQAWSPQWRWAFAYTWLDATYRRPFGAVAAGNHIPGVPRHDAWSELRWMPGAGFDLALSASGVDRVWANDANTASAPGFTRVELGLERRWDVRGAGITSFVRAANLLDTDAVGSVIVNESNGRYFEPAPGRTWWFGLSTGIAAGHADTP